MQLHPGKMPSAVTRLSPTSRVTCGIHWISTTVRLNSFGIQTLHREEEEKVGKGKRRQEEEREGGRVCSREKLSLS